MIRVRDDMLELLERTAYESSKLSFTVRKKERQSNSLTQDKGKIRVQEEMKLERL